MINWDDFRVFLALHRERSLSGAARTLQVDQSTVGRRLLALESASGAKLFHRTPDGYVLTPAGETVRTGMELIEQNAIAVERKLMAHDKSLEGRVRLATSDSLAVWFIEPHLFELRQKHPGISLELVTGNPPVNLARRDADLSLRLSKPEQPNLLARCIGTGQWALYASLPYVAKRGRPKPELQLMGHDIIALSGELSATAGARWLAAHGVKGRVVLSANSLLCQAAAVTQGLGVGPLPCVFGDQAPELVRVIKDCIGHHDIWLVIHPDVKHSARVRAVADFLTELAAREAALLAGKHRAVPAKPLRRASPKGRAY